MAFGYDSDLVSSTPTPRVLTVGPVPAEKLAYALARYSRSPDSVKESLEWVRTHDSSKFLESFYFQYGHASIADLAIWPSALKASPRSRPLRSKTSSCGTAGAQFAVSGLSKSGFVTPPELNEDQRALYQAAGQKLMDAYRAVHARVFEHLCEKLPKPETMKATRMSATLRRGRSRGAVSAVSWSAHGRGQVTSIRTLESRSAVEVVGVRRDP